MTAAPRWVARWRDHVAPHPVAPGVYRRRDGGFIVRAVVTDPRTGRRREVFRTLPDVRLPRDASAALTAAVTELRARLAGDAPAAERPRFADYAATIFARKVADGRILSAAGREKWRVLLTAHLVPAFGEFFVDRLTAADVEEWKGRFATKIRAGAAKPTSGNTILSVLRVITAAAADEFDIRDPMRRVRPFDTRGHRTYTDEAPNSLAPADVPRFLTAMRERFPHYYAITLLGFVTGLRPSSLRPLRRRGDSPDLDLDAGVLLVRQSHTRGAEIMPATKTGRDQRIRLPAELVTVLRAHVDTLAGRAATSDLLFPSTTGGFLPVKALAEPFEVCARAIGLVYRVTPRAMRRTMQDLAREAGVSDVVTRAISGHATASMQRHYSTARDHEVATTLGQLVAHATAGATLAN